MLVDPSHYLHILMCFSSEDVSSMKGTAISYSREQAFFSPHVPIFLRLQVKRFNTAERVTKLVLKSSELFNFCSSVWAIQDRTEHFFFIPHIEFSIST